jgi:hypothetical protein
MLAASSCSAPPDEPVRPHRKALVNQVTAAQALATKDRFGIAFLQPTAPWGTQWVSNWTGSRHFTGVDPRDTWFDADHGSASYDVSDGMLSISGAVPRMYVHDPDRKRQWRDVEVTVYFRRRGDDSVPYAGMVAVARSNHLSDIGPQVSCDTRGYGARVRYDGNTDFEKETAHPLNEAYGQQDLWRDGLPTNVWIGFKLLVYDKSDGVHLETWIDQAGGKDRASWTMANELVDDGHVFGKDPCAEGIDPQMALTSSSHREGSESGRPNLSVYFRSDGVHKHGLQYKWASIREIVPRP